MSNALSLILGVLFFPITILGSWIVVHPQEEAVVMMWESEPCLGSTIGGSTCWGS